jgi:hypothetical protein
VLFVIFQGLQERITGTPVATKENDVALLDEENENKIYRVALLGLTVTVMQSCFIAKDYKRPELKTADLYRNEVVSTDTTSLANIWNKIFTDSLCKAIFQKDYKTI